MTTPKKSLRKFWHWFVYGDWHHNDNGYPKHAHKVLFFRLLGIATIIYLGLWLYLFHNNMKEISPGLQSFWMLTLAGYAALNNAYKWIGVKTPDHWGELFAWLVIATFSWMEAVNMYNKVVLGLDFRHLPDGAYEATCEALILLVFSNIFSIYINKKNEQKLKNNTNDTISTTL